MEDNLIGDLGGREVMDALIDRKEGTCELVKLVVQQHSESRKRNK